MNIIEKDFFFDSAHFLPCVPLEHKCRNLHGHTYKLTVGIKGHIIEETGWIIDFAEIRKIVEPIVENLDHKLLNSIPGLENPTAEIIAKYIFQKVKEQLINLYFIKIEETPTSRFIYFGDEK
ncbi:MAG: 6-carboxytetrahydropterin synthase QueD [Spirochaetia bacterium]|nr:6-carboxytetrahydropterin synthase QueD [Spirochaetia bacterium]